MTRTQPNHEIDFARIGAQRLLSHSCLGLSKKRWRTLVEGRREMPGFGARFIGGWSNGTLVMGNAIGANRDLLLGALLGDPDDRGTGVTSSRAGYGHRG